MNCCLPNPKRRDVHHIGFSEHHCHPNARQWAADAQHLYAHKCARSALGLYQLEIKWGKPRKETQVKFPYRRAAMFYLWCKKVMKPSVFWTVEHRVMQIDSSAADDSQAFDTRRIDIHIAIALLPGIVKIITWAILRDQMFSLYYRKVLLGPRVWNVGFLGATQVTLHHWNGLVMIFLFVWVLA